MLLAMVRVKTELATLRLGYEGELAETRCFCRAMLCISADYVVMRCLSVRLPVGDVRVFCPNE